MKLLIARHGDYDLFSEEKNINDTGVQGSHTIGTRLKQKNLRLNRIYHSGINRARQTAEILSGYLLPGEEPVFLENTTPDEDIFNFSVFLEQQSKDFMLVGHQPFFEKLLVHLIGNDFFRKDIRIYKSSVVCLEKKDDFWDVNWVEHI